MRFYSLFFSKSLMNCSLSLRQPPAILEHGRPRASCRATKERAYYRNPRGGSFCAPRSLGLRSPLASRLFQNGDQRAQAGGLFHEEGNSLTQARPGLGPLFADTGAVQIRSL